MIGHCRDTVSFVTLVRPVSASSRHRLFNCFRKSVAAISIHPLRIRRPTGRSWQGEQLQRMAARLDLNHPLGRLARGVARARVQALWQKHSDFTAKQIKANLGLEHPSGCNQAFRLLKECRRDAANRCPEHKCVNGYLDCRTTDRIKVSALSRPHPEFMTMQIIRRLGVPFVREPWVQLVMRECRLAYTRRTAAPRRVPASRRTSM
jgi:hypothetical protein